MSDAAARIGAELVALFEQVGVQPDKVQWVYRRIAAGLTVPQDPTLDRACLALAASIDAQGAGFDRNAYHNRQHFCEVMLTARALAALNGLGTEATQLLVLAAMIHDFVHDGRPHPAFEQERASVERARPLLEAAGLPATALLRLRALVLATDTLRGTACMAAACAAHAGVSPGGGVADVPDEAPELAALFVDAQLAGMARLLCEADVLPSVGLGAAHAMRLQQRLSLEWGRPLDAQDKRAFIEQLLRLGYVSEFFRPQILAMRDAIDDATRV